MMPQIGNKRTFTFLPEPCEIVDIVENSDIKLIWKWQDLVCPHCQKRIEKIKEHILNRVELLIPCSKMDVDILQKKHHLVIIGFDQQGKTMLLPREKYPEVIEKSKFTMWR